MRTIFIILLTAAASALENGFTKPPMGWSALYGAPFGSVNETKVTTAAAALVSGGFKAAGYNYVVLDDWYAERDSSGKIFAKKETFPSGMRAVSDSVHSHGIGLGVYSAAGQRTCANYSASLFREVEDATTFAKDWQIDYLKYDACKYQSGIVSRARYLTMSRALNATGRKIFYSVEGWSPAEGNWGPELSNMWRTGSDIWPRWDGKLSILNNLYTTNDAASFMVPGKAFNDPDMLQAPGYVPGSALSPGLTFEESRTQFVMWAAMRAPLMLGLNYAQIAGLKTNHPEYFDVITNNELIAMDQDFSGPAVVVAQMPSQAQQQLGVVLDVTYQDCDLGE
jgi:alpha-galactosidase